MKNKFYITTAIDYVNGAPHIGHAIQKVWSDIIARYHKGKGENVYFLSGADEHGLSVVRAAEKLGKKVEDLVEENTSKFRSLKELLNLSYDDFIRTTDQKRHWPGAIEMWNRLVSAGDIYKKKYQGLYCVGHEAFITSKDLVDGKCPLHGKEPEFIEEENYFFKLSKYNDAIKKEIEAGNLKIVPESRKNEVLSLLKQGLEDVSFSRPVSSLKWGIPVPGDPSHVMYVWCDALTNYISALGFGTPNQELFKKYWPADVHVLGKDNLRFHAAIWPGMLLSAGLPLPKTIFCHGFVTVDGKKMSKTLGNFIDPIELSQKYGSEVVRYYMAREIPTHEDGDFSEGRLRERYTSDLANGLGNLVQRVATLIDTKMDGEIIYHEKLLPDIEELNEVEDDTEIHRAIDNFKLHEALALIWKKIDVANAFVNEEAPWKLVDENPEQFQKVMLALTEMVHHIAWNLQPFLPETAARIREVFGDTNGKEIPNEFRFFIKKGAVLFPRL